jgi:hypothetical protein
MMKRIFSVLWISTLMALMLVVMAAPASAGVGSRGAY